MALDDELKKAKEALERKPSLSREDYERGLQWLKERFGEKRLVEFNRETDLANATSDVSKLLQFMEELRGQGVELCDDCIIKTAVNFFKKLDDGKAH